MPEKKSDNNRVSISGEIASDFRLSHEIFGEKFYTSALSSKRRSEKEDIVPIMVSERIVDAKADWKGKFVCIAGQFRSYNKHEKNRSRLVLTVFAKEFESLHDDDGTAYYPDVNNIFLDGYVCKEPSYRETPLGREISDIIIAVNRQYGNSDYIPCVCWGRNARFAGNLDIGTHVRLEGRIQSREYRNKIADDEFETRTAYEVSANKIETVG